MTHDESRMDGREHGRGRLYAAVGFVILVLAALYVAAAFYFGDRVPGDTTVEGVTIGGMTKTEARTALREGLTDEASEPVVITVDDEKRTIDPDDAGLSYDYEASLDGLTGFSLNPVNLWAQATGGIERDVEVDVDEEALAAAVDKETEGMDAKPVEGTVKLDGATVKTRASKAGLTVERDELTRDIADGWPDQHEFEAPTSRPEPKLKQKDIDTFIKDELKPLIAAPVTVQAGASDGEDISFTVAPEQLALAVSVTNDEGALATKMDEGIAAEATATAAKDSGKFPAAKDAVVTRSGSSFDVAPSSTGLSLTTEGVGAKVVEAMGKSGDERVVTASTTKTQPELTTQEAKDSLPKEPLSTFTTYLPDNPVRTANIRLAARTLNGAYVAPGETFSLNEQLGQRTPGKGYKQAGVIYNGRLAKDYGGGISQLSTTLFNAIFFSGAKIEEFHPHSFYISRYPEGREATISWPNVDNVFTNDTGAGILINAAVNGNEVTVSFDGRKKYDEIRAAKSPRRNVVEPERITDDSKKCVPQSPNPGFTVDITRSFIKGGSTVKSSSFTTVYDAADHIVCTG
ncbi:VanW family protein [Janibacter cremeus]|uniref:Vancomycin resistance protein YoaR n=1 Tax=Janibacter cremeus TaxID=1285192 RepID=A0A852VKE1_9MICO|nr:VanW family protein [Janibacter cremeus]NYF97522.1 vancomycin resistance protein YoaR [Janibacter cremeus]